MGADIHAEVTVGFDDAAFGGKKVVRLQDENGRMQSLEVQIPAGIEDGKTIRLRGKGQQGQGGGSAGDLLLKVHVCDKPGIYKERKRRVYNGICSLYNCCVRRRGSDSDNLRKSSM